jgi:hypothetical protein
MVRGTVAVVAGKWAEGDAGGPGGVWILLGILGFPARCNLSERRLWGLRFVSLKANSKPLKINCSR